MQLLSDKYSTEFGLDCDLSPPEQLIADRVAQTASNPSLQVLSNQPASDEDDEMSEENLLMSKARGRH